MYFRLINNWFKNITTSFVLCSTQSCTYIFATMFLIETFKKSLVCADNRKNITKTHAMTCTHLQTASWKFCDHTCHLWWRSSQLATMYDDVTVTSGVSFIGVCFSPLALTLGFEGQGLGVRWRGRGRGRGKTEKWDSPLMSEEYNTSSKSHKWILSNKTPLINYHST